ncbi:MAG: hypothetical protein ACD_78C00453G0002, partial [uncultured bacterium (gcode 4)]
MYILHACFKGERRIAGEHTVKEFRKFRCFFFDCRFPIWVPSSSDSEHGTMGIDHGKASSYSKAFFIKMKIRYSCVFEFFGIGLGNMSETQYRENIIIGSESKVHSYSEVESARFTHLFHSFISNSRHKHISLIRIVYTGTEFDAVDEFFHRMGKLRIYGLIWVVCLHSAVFGRKIHSTKSWQQ